MRMLAPAKINLALEVLRRRDDGYHEVRTVLQAVDLCDELLLGPSNSLSLRVEPEGAAPVEGNLVLLAAQRLRSAFGVSAGAAITLRKRIPTAAGLGGGSSDAAAALLGLRMLWGLRVPVHDLAPIAAGLGSDVSFFLFGGTALGEGRGEVLTPLPRPLERFAVLLTPDAPPDDAKTRRLYGLLRPEHFSDGRRTAELIERLHRGMPVASAMLNTFEAVATVAYTGYSAARAAFVEAGAEHILLSGAGPSLFSLATEEAEAQAICRRLLARQHRAFVVRLLPAWGDHGYVDA